MKRLLTLPNGLILLVLALNYAADRFSKIWAESYLAGKDTIQVVGDFFVLRLAHNSGAFLSMGSSLGDTLRFILLAVLPAIVLVGGTGFLLWKSHQLDRFQQLVWASLIGGGLSNIYDRLFNGGLVIDFMNFGIGNLRTGILNVADLSITFGAIALIFAGMKKKEVKSE